MAIARIAAEPLLQTTAAFSDAAVADLFLKLLLLRLVLPVVLDNHPSACHGQQWRHASILLTQIQDLAGSILH